MDDIEQALKEKGYRVTPGRIRLLQILKGATKPMSVRDILKRAKGDFLDQVTLYRAIESFSKKGLVTRVDLNQASAHYEYVGKHHHHVVCTGCGIVEDFSDMLCNSVVKKATKKSSSFKTINSHSLELFGLCTNCS
jgi:Fe2+ or Zn2+ uptake regulation protein